jgi:tetraacyldisaccharide 4'-kinase
LRDVYSGEEHTLEWLKGKKIMALSGIAVPQGCEDFLKNHGAILVRVKRYADHHRYAAKEILAAINRAADAGADALITTEKDAVRFPNLKSTAVPVYYLRVDIEILNGADIFENVLRRVCEKKPKEPPTP